MKTKRIFTVLVFLILTSLSQLFSTEFKENQLRGKALCDTIFTFLNDNHFNPETQDLILKGTNDFPYNITVSINCKKYSNKNLVFTFFQEDVLSNKKIFIDIINYIKSNDFDFNTIFLFSYGEREIVKKQGMIYGVDSFLQTINSNDDYTNIIVDLSSNENSVQTSSNGITAPSWLIQNEYNAYIKYNLSERIPFFYISQLYSLDFFYDRVLTSFFNYDVPSVKLNFLQNNINNELVYSILKESIESYKSEESRLWDHHFLMINLFGQFKKITEVGTIRIIILILFAWLVFILLLIFINIRLKKQAWGSLKKIWYAAPLSFFLVYVSFIGGKFITMAFTNNNSPINNVFILISLQLIISIVLVSIYYTITLNFNFSFTEKSIDYLIVISCFVNQSFFILIDVSLFPIFMTICILSIIALSVKNNGIHIAIFFLMGLPFLPYIISLVRFANFNSLYDFLINENFVPFFISLILFPTYLIYLRVLTSIKRHSHLNLFVLSAIITGILTIFIVISSIILSSYLNNKQEHEKDLRIYQSYEKIINISYEDKKVFDDIIRTVTINFEEQPEQCNVNITSLTTSPILYTENEFEYVTPTTSTFKLPSNPPTALTFTYGSNNEPTLITVSAIFPTGRHLEYKSVKKVVTIGK